MYDMLTKAIENGQSHHRGGSGKVDDVKRVALWVGLALTLLGQGAGFGYNLARIEESDRRITSIEQQSNQQPTRVEFTDLKDSVRRIEGKVDVLVQQEATFQGRYDPNSKKQ